MGQRSFHTCLAAVHLAFAVAACGRINYSPVSRGLDADVVGIADATPDSDTGAGAADSAQGGCPCPAACPECACVTDHKRVFVSSATFTGDLRERDATDTPVTTGLDGADAKCQRLADQACLGGTYRAWLSDRTGSPSTRFVRSALPYRRVDGVLVADSFADLLARPMLAASISVTERKQPASVPMPYTCGGAPVWSSTTPTQGGTIGCAEAATGPCDNWSTEAADVHTAGIGDATSTEASGSGARWFNACCATGPSVCSRPASLFCFEQ